MSAAKKLNFISSIDKLQRAMFERVQAPHGPEILKVKWQEFLKMQSDPAFEPMSKYINNLLCYADGRPRAKPIRPLLQNEVGMYKGKFVILADAGPDDAGEGKYHQVHVSTPLKADKKETIESEKKDASKEG